MSGFDRNKLVQYVACAGSFSLVIGLLFSRALQSFGIFLIAVSPFLMASGFRGVWIGIRRNPLSLGLIVLYLISLLSFLYAEHKDLFAEKLTVKLPFLLLGIGLARPETLGRKYLFWTLHLFCLAVFTAGLISAINYFLHFEQINAQVIHSKPIPILWEKISHIYYSMLLAFAVFAAAFLFLRSESRWLKGYCIFLGLGMMLFLHTIAARTGVLAFYGSCGIALLWWVIRYGQVWKAMLLGVLAAGIFLLAYTLSPSWQNRAENTRRDIGKLGKGHEMNYYSIAMRMEALRISKTLYQKHPILGVGEGDLVPEIEKEYELQQSPLMKENRTLPHNQFVQTLVTTGIPGLLALLALFILPWLRKVPQHLWLYLAFLSVVFLSAQVESVLERQVGIGFFCFFYLTLPLLSELGLKGRREDMITQ